MGIVLTRHFLFTEILLMPSRTVTITFKTQAELANLDKLTASLKNLKAAASGFSQLKGLDTFITRLDTLNKAAALAKTNITGLGSALNTFNNASTKAAAAATAQANAAKNVNQATQTTSALIKNTTTTTTAATGAVTRNAQAVTQQTSTLKQNNTTTVNVTRTVQQQAQVIKQATMSYQQFMKSLQAFRTIASGVLNILSALARALASTLRAAITAASIAFSTFGKAASATFAGLQRAVNGISNTLKSFAGAVKQHMSNATRSIKDFYNAGWSLLTSGYVTKSAGSRMLGGVFGGLDEFMDYEKSLTRAAIAGSQSPSSIEEIIFGMQRGTGGQAPIRGFDAKEISQAIYFYASAIGTAVSDVNKDVVSTILQMASVTQTSVETATKGVINIAQEFGIDTRSTDKATQDKVANIAAQVGYLANLSTMEVPDIIEAFKYIGPMAHILAPENAPGAGLNEAFTATFLASELGIRGGQSGRGVAQLLTTLLDPTDATIEAAAKAFGFGLSEEAFHEFFFNAEGNLKGGLGGLFDKLGKLPESSLPQVLAALFTQNATRSSIAITEASFSEAIKKKGGWAGIMKDIGGSNPMEWLSKAQLETNNTIFTSFQNLKNAWFAVQTEMIRSVEGPLKKGFSTLAEILGRMGDILHNNPWIAQFITGITTAIGILLSVVGTLFIVSGSILLVMKAFTMLGGLAGPALFFFTSMISSLLILVPLMVALAAAVVLVRDIWNNNTFGVQDQLFSLLDKLKENLSWLVEYGPDVARVLASVFQSDISSLVTQAGDKLAENRDTIQSLISLLRTFASGIAEGFVGTIVVAVRAAIVAFQALASFLLSFVQRVDAIVEKFTGFNITAQNLSQTLGRLVGIGLGAWLIFALSPFKTLVVYALQFSAVAIKLGGTLVVLAGQFALFIARIVLSTAAMVANAAVTTALAGAEAILTGAKFLLNIATGTGTVSEWLFTQAKLAGITATAGLSGALTILTAVLSPLVLVVLALVAAFASLFLIGAAMAGVGTLLAGAFLIVVAATDGLGAALQGLISFMEGVWAGMRIGFGLLLMVAKAIFELTNAFLQSIGIQNSFYAIGVMVGVGITAMIVGFLGLAAVLTGVAVAAFLALIGVMVGFLIENALVILAIGAVIVAVGGVLIALDQFTDWNPFEAIVGGLKDIIEFAGRAAYGLYYLGTESSHAASKGAQQVEYEKIMASTTAMRTERDKYVNDALSTYAGSTSQTDAQGNPIAVPHSEEELAQVRQKALDDWNKAHGGYKYVYTTGGDWTGGSLAGTMQVDPIQYQELNATNTANARTAGMTDSSTAKVSSLASYLNKIFDSTGIDDVLTKWGINVDALRSGDFGKVFGMDNIKNLNSAYDSGALDFLGPQMEKYMDAVHQYTQYKDLVDKIGKERANFMYTITGMAIPTVPDFTDYIEGYDTAIEDTTEDVTTKIADMNKSIADALAQGMDLSQAIKFKFDLGQGTNGRDYIGVGSVLATYADTISQNIPEGATWSNIYEGIMDTMSSGGNGNMYGKNIHTALANSPGFVNWTKEMGISVGDALKGVPQFVADEKYVPLAFADIADQVSTYLDNNPTFDYSILDHLGADIGKGIDGAGLDWLDLSQFATSELQAGKTDWNLVTYLQESWNMTKGEAEKYLSDHGVDPNIVNGALFPDLQLMMESAGGSINVFTPEWYAWFEEHTSGGVDKIIEITQQAFDDMPENIKISISGLGFSFVITEPDAAAEKLRAHIREVLFGGNNGINDAAAKGQPVATGGWARAGMYNNLFGADTPAPATTLPGLPDSMDYTTQGTTDATAYLTAISDTVSANTDTAVFDSLFAGYATSAAESFKTTLQTNLLTGLGDIAAATGSAVGGDTAVGSTATAGPYDAMFAAYGLSAASAFKKAVNANIFVGLDPTVAAEGSSDVAAKGPSSGPFDGIFSSYATSAITSFISQVQADWAAKVQPKWTQTGLTAGPFDDIFKQYGSTAVTAFKTQVTADLIALAADLNATGMYLGMMIAIGVANGIRSAIPLVAAAASEMSAAATSTTTTQLALHSPSRVFHEYGANVGEGFALGIESSIDRNADAMYGLVNGVQQAASIDVSGTSSSSEASLAPIYVTIENITISKDVDVKKALDTFQTELGRQVELAKRGMQPVKNPR